MAAESGRSSTGPSGPGGRRSQNRRGEGGRLHSEILDAATRVLAARGASALTLRAVAREAGISPPAIYLQFADRDELVVHLLRKTWAELAEHMREAGDAAAADGPYAELVAHLLAYVEFATSNATRYEQLFALHPEPAMVVGEGLAPPSPVYDALSQVVTRCREAGYVFPFPAADEPADRATVLLFVIAHGRVALSNAVQTTPFSLPQITVDFVLDSLGTLVQPPG